MVHPVHIPLDRRKIIAARLIFFEAAEPLALNAAQSGAANAFNNFRNLYHSYFDWAANESEPSAALDQFLLDTLGRIKAPSEALFSKYLPLFKSIWTAIELNAKQMACQLCSHLPHQICDNGDYDAEIVHKRGHCIKPLRRMFTLASDVAQTYYSNYAKLNPVRPDVVFATGFCNSREELHDFPIPYSVTGVTEFPSRGQVSRVKLRFVPASFDWDTYAANLYILFHECVCHAFHAITPTCLDRKPLPPFDTFAEGWMDWVAYKVLEEVLNGQGPAAHLVSNLNLPPDCFSRASRYHEARRDFRDPKRSKYASFAYMGSDAAKRLLAFFEKHLYKGEAAKALEKFYRLSFDITMLRVENDTKKGAFVALVGCLPEDARPQNYTQEMAIRILEQYIAHEDAAALLDQAYNVISSPRP
jgi:hypothetical protein